MQEKIRFAPLIVGAMRFGTWGVDFNSKEMEQLIDECLDLGLSDFDHADIYGHYTEEGRFGEVLKRRSDLKQKVEITTKCGIQMVSPNRPHKLKSYNGSKSHIVWSVENALKELGVEQVKLLLIHRPDYLLEPAEVAEAIDQLKEQGKIIHFGVSNFSTSQFDLLNKYAQLVTNQVEFSVTHTDPLDDGTFDQCIRNSIHPMIWSPFGGGELFKESNDPRIQSIQKIASDLGNAHSVEMDQILLAWTLRHPSQPIAVTGTSKIERIKKALEATTLKLNREEWYMLLEAARGHEVA